MYLHSGGDHQHHVTFGACWWDGCIWQCDKHAHMCKRMHAGTGKSVYVGRHLVGGLPKEKWTPVFITFSARTTANMTQEQVGCAHRTAHIVPAMCSAS